MVLPDPIETIPLARLALAFVPVAAVVVILWKWRLDYKVTLYAMSRMLVQLLLIGYVLVFLFEEDSGFVISGVLAVMLVAASWIAMRNLSVPWRVLLPKTLLAIGLSGCGVLAIITEGVLALDPWFEPSKVIPLAGMIFATAMNSVSLAGERVEAELARAVPFQEARLIALRTALIPITNSLFAVGLVSLPGMMTGQILSGVSPFIAARYQIMVMCMIFGAAGISATLFLVLARRDFASAGAEGSEAP
jgi:putative ABC transport system permease protein